MKVGLIAMSGIRAQNPELNALGLTLPGVVERSRAVASLPSLGLLTIAGLTPDRFDIRYLDVPVLPEQDDLPGEFDAVAISSFSAQIKEAYALADRYRSRGTKVILGGLHVTALPGEALCHADATVLGEGEIGWPAVLRDLESGQLRRVYDGRHISFDLSDSPVPRYELLDAHKYNRITVQTQRGCPWACDFCAASPLLSASYKLKPVDRVIAEIRRIRELWPNPFIEFADDNSFVNKSHSKRLLRALAAEQIRWFTETDLSVADDPELLALMRDSGCVQVLIGLEAASPAALDGIEQRANWKARQLTRYLSAVDRIQNCGIAVNGCFILGLDGSGPECFDDVLRFVRDSGLYEVQITIQTAFPGTPLYARLKREGRLLRDNAWELCTLFDVNFRPARMSVAELESGFRMLAATLYSDECIRERRLRFLSRLRANRERAGGSERQ
ncbi:MAG TPA: radical SAM protein [Bryobacteraceae bacterium]|nr:radical SAM protein [Bryobacteraceae bacterium]